MMTLNLTLKNWHRMLTTHPRYHVHVYIVCLNSRTTVTSVRILEEDVFHRARNLCVFSHVQKGTPGLTHKDCVLQRVSLCALSDVTVVLRMRQSIVLSTFGVPQMP